MSKAYMHIGGQLQCTLPEHTRTNWKGRLERCIIGNNMKATLADERERERDVQESEREMILGKVNMKQTRHPLAD